MRSLDRGTALTKLSNRGHVDLCLQKNYFHADVRSGICEIKQPTERSSEERDFCRRQRVVCGPSSLDL